MASWVFCNRCFQPPHRTSCFSLTSCGHVYCHVCLGKGGKDECAVCRAPCRTVLLSKNADWDVQALFLRVDGLCARYSRDTAQIAEFQEKHRRRLWAFHREKVGPEPQSLRLGPAAKHPLTPDCGGPCLSVCLLSAPSHAQVSRLEDALRRSALEVQQLQSSVQKATRLPAAAPRCASPCSVSGCGAGLAGAGHALVALWLCSGCAGHTQGPGLAGQHGQALPPGQRDSATSSRAEPMDVDLGPSPRRRGHTADPHACRAAWPRRLLAQASHQHLGAAAAAARRQVPGRSGVRRGPPPDRTLLQGPCLGGSGSRGNKGWIVPVLGSSRPGRCPCRAPGAVAMSAAQQAPNLRAHPHPGDGAQPVTKPPGL
ncbi:putative E3 SUMO-protein ligase RNF212 [Galemys pyrenaicus]|uniref:Putative E3 SUMO-protein ligase RNF212 n=1 Tax=Galemys pyrenaicus TaxID=202257 RepID=A0A8J6DJP0_GALPY|nr:putative E3 SUMO-protein ligase RNF212 [Galemys pyrenaicus]